MSEGVAQGIVDTEKGSPAANSRNEGRSPDPIDTRCRSGASLESSIGSVSSQESTSTPASDRADASTGACPDGAP